MNPMRFRVKMNCRSLSRNLALLTLVLFAMNGFSQERKIKPGDAMEIVVYGQEELSQTVVVRSDGTINYPFVEGIPIDDLTVRRFQQILVSQLSTYIERTPLVTVRFTKTYPISVTVSGQVVRPGIYQLSSNSTCQSAIEAAGGLTPGAQLSRVKITRVEEGRRINHEVNLEKFYLDGDIYYLPKLQAGDTVVVPGNPLATTVKVLGGVIRPGSYEVSFGTSLLDVIFLAGGPSNDANLGKVRLISLRGQNAREVRINIKNISKSEDIRSIPLVVAGDVVFVPQKSITWRKFINFMRDLVIFATLFYLIDQANN